ncbi:unnamed protein product [Trifolium pratense]|uniref:Uncharacterized protein n=1 Tax=Trifolium pratense TaxID=57577 RepID=A0ACB0ILJ2_TRIPR|nr:unnamed protein product [Trifolium pratense]
MRWMEMEWGAYFKSIVVQLDEKTTGYVDLAENKSSALSRAGEQNLGQRLLEARNLSVELASLLVELAFYCLDIGRLEESGKFV